MARHGRVDAVSRNCSIPSRCLLAWARCHQEAAPRQTVAGPQALKELGGGREDEDEGGELMSEETPASWKEGSWGACADRWDPAAKPAFCWASSHDLSQQGLKRSGSTLGGAAGMGQRAPGGVSLVAL